MTRRQMLVLAVLCLLVLLALALTDPWLLQGLW